MAVIDREDRSRYLSAGTQQSDSARKRDESVVLESSFSFAKERFESSLDGTNECGEFPSVNNRLVPRGNRGLSHPSEFFLRGKPSSWNEIEVASIFLLYKSSFFFLATREFFSLSVRRGRSFFYDVSIRPGKIGVLGFRRRILARI